MAFTPFVYCRMIESAFEARINFPAHDIGFALFTDALVPSQDNDKFFDAAPYTANQVQGINYPAGGISLGSGVLNLDLAANKLYVDLTNPLYEDISLDPPYGARWGVFYNRTPAANKPLIMAGDFGGNQFPTNGTLTVNIAELGAFAVNIPVPV